MRIQHTDRYILMSNKTKNTNDDVVMTPKRDPVREAVAQEIRKQQNETLLEESKQYWSDLDKIYESISQTIIMSGITIRDLLLIEGIKERLNDRHEMVIAINGFNKDLDTFSKALRSVYDKHAGRTGLITGDDFIKSIEIFEEYRALSLQFDAVVMPNIVHISTEIGYTADAILAERAAQEAIATNAPTTEETL